MNIHESILAIADEALETVSQLPDDLTYHVTIIELHAVYSRREWRSLDWYTFWSPSD